jgi:DNA (cytosine-5)-methyltransferase 1
VRPREELHGLALCAGIGGLELGLRAAFPGLRLVGVVERDPFAASVLVARMEEAALDPAPIFDDLRSFDGRAWRGVVDLVSAGYPCQPFSVAGKRLGDQDERHLWPEVRRIIDECAPALVCLENVAGHVRLGLDAVLGDLAALGFDAEWGVVAASDAGAPHRRERVFVLAYRGDHGRALCRAAHDHDGGHEPWDVAHGRDPRVADALGGRGERSRNPGGSVADPAGWGGEARAARPRQRPADAHERGEGMAHADGARGHGDGLHERDEPGHLAAHAREHGGRRAPAAWPPRPDDRDGWAEVLRARPDLEPAVRRVAHGIPDRVDRLRCLGNGAVPRQVTLAFIELTRRALLSESLPA